MRQTCTKCHKYNGQFEPRTNCQSCWDIYFMRNQMASNATRYALETFGREVAIKVRGEKHIAAFERFLSA